MGNPATTPMLSPDGQVGDIPSERVHEAVQGGFKLAQEMIAPDGSHGVIPLDSVHDAIKKGFQLKPPGMPQPPNPITTPDKRQRYSDIIGPNGGPGAPGEAEAATGNVSATEMAKGALKAMGQNVVGTAELATPLGVPAVAAQVTGKQNPVDAALQPSNADQQSGATATNDALTASGALALPEAAEGVAGALDARQAAKVRAVMPEATKALPDKAIVGAEKVIRAAAPTGIKSAFRTQVYTAAGDLAEVGQKVQQTLKDSAGGIVSPDMRVRATVSAIDEHLSDMYKNERLAQISKAPDAPVKLPTTTDAQAGLDYVSRSAGEAETRTLAEKAKSGTLTLSEADQLARQVNSELRNFEKLSPSERARMLTTDRGVAGLKALDKGLASGLNDTLQANGQPGLSSYERRYAALSQVRDQLKSRINSAELQRTRIPLAGPKKTVASASQAAVADVRPGKMLQKGLRALSDSGIQPDRATPKPPPE